MKLNIPFYSQYSNSIEKEWQSRSCAVLCLKMLFDFYGIKTEIANLIKEGLIISNDLAQKGKLFSGYTKEHGWGHDLLVILLNNHNLLSYRQDFRSMKIDLENKIFLKSEFEFIDQGVKKIEKQIESKKPVIVSVAKNIENKRKTGHVILITGFEKKREIVGFYFNDPEMKNESEGKDVFVNINDFKKVWKKLAIFVEK
jgi:hypothetical protein